MKVQKHLNNTSLVKINTLILNTNEIRPSDLSFSSFFSDSFFFLKLKDWNVNKIKFWTKVFNFQTKGTKKDFWEIIFLQKKASIFSLFQFWPSCFQYFSNNKIEFFSCEIFVWASNVFFFFTRVSSHPFKGWD